MCLWGPWLSCEDAARPPLPGNGPILSKMPIPRTAGAAMVRERRNPRMSRGQLNRPLSSLPRVGLIYLRTILC